MLSGWTLYQPDTAFIKNHAPTPTAPYLDGFQMIYQGYLTQVLEPDASQVDPCLKGPKTHCEQLLAKWRPVGAFPCLKKSPQFRT